MISLADAIIEEKIDTIREGLSYGVDLNQLDEYGFTPLIEAAIADNTPAPVKVPGDLKPIIVSPVFGFAR